MENDEIIYGYHAIGVFLNMTAEQARRRLRGSNAPTFKMGKKVAARPTALREWLQKLEREAFDAARESSTARPACEHAAEE